MVPPEDASLTAATDRVSPEHNFPIIQLPRVIHGACSSLYPVNNVSELSSPESREHALESGASPPDSSQVVRNSDDETQSQSDAPSNAPRGASGIASETDEIPSNQKPSTMSPAQWIKVSVPFSVDTGHG